MARFRPDHDGVFRTQFDKNKKKIFATQNVCAICGKVVDYDIKYPHPLAPTIDHIVPINKGGHPSDMSNLQLAHFCCNRAKSDKLEQSVGNGNKEGNANQPFSNRVLPQTTNWLKYRSE